MNTYIHDHRPGDLHQGTLPISPLRPRRPEVDRTAPAFTRVELLAILAIVGLLLAATLPAMAGLRSRGDRVVCVNNLRQVGLAFRTWAQDNGELFPTQVGFPAGLYQRPPSINSWVQFAWVSNQLATPKALFCPSDQTPGAVISRDWAEFLQPSRRNNSVSYFLATHAAASNPRAVLAGDHNVRPTSLLDECRYLAPGASVAVSIAANDPNLAWTNSVHGLTGNLLTADGAVLETDSSGLRAAFRKVEPVENGRQHLLRPH